MEIYEKLFTDEIANCDPGDLVEFEWHDFEEDEKYTEIIRISEIDVSEMVILKGYSEITGDNVTKRLFPDMQVTVLGG